MRRPSPGRAALLALPTLAVLAVLSAVWASSGSKPGAALRPTPESIAQAARRTLASPSGRFALTVTSTAGGERASFSGSGAYDRLRRRTAIRIDLSSLGEPGVGALEVRFLDGVGYLRLPWSGSEWTRYDSSALGAGTGAEFGATLTDPSGLLAQLLTVEGRVELAGSESVRGVETTHLAVNAPRRADVFIDRNGFVRRLQLELFEASEPGGPATRVEVDYFDFGADVLIEAPPG